MSSKPESDAPSDVKIPQDMAEMLLKGEVPLGEFLGLSREKLFDFATLGHSMLQAGRTRLALDIFLGLVDASPREPAFLTQLGATYMTLERTDEAFDAYQRALALQSANVDALVGRGEIQLRRGNVPEGLKDLSRAIEFDPSLQRRSTQRARGTLLAIKKQAEQLKARPASRK